MIDLYQGDCLGILKTLPDACVSAVITDPPYGTNEEGKDKLNGTLNGEAKPFEIDWDRELPLDWIIEATRLLKPGGAFLAFTDQARITLLWDEVARLKLRPLHCFYWVKPNAPLNPRKNFRSSIEAAVFARKDGSVLAWNGSSTALNSFVCPTVPGGDSRLHPTQKPLPLMRHLVRLLSNCGDVVLDPFMGSGTTLVACKQLGRSGIGIERDADYFKAARERINGTTACLDLDEPPPPSEPLQEALEGLL